MESSLSFLEKIAGLLIFCMALSILLMEYSVMQNTITSLRRAINNQEVLYDQSLEVINEGLVPYAGVVGILMSELTCDITINNIEINKDTYNPLTFDFTRIHNTSYKKSYEINLTGDIVKIIFTK